MHIAPCNARTTGRTTTGPITAPTTEPDARLLRQARAVVTVHQKRAFLDRLARQPMKMLMRLVVPDPSGAMASRIWSDTWGSRCLVDSIAPRIIQADTQGRLFTDSRGHGDPVTQLLFWEPAPGNPQRAVVHAASVGGHHPADMTEASVVHLVRQGFREAEVRVGADQPELAERFQSLPGWQAIPLDGGDLLFRRDLCPALPEV